MFYRVEKDGVGPYRGPEGCICDGRASRQHPGYYDDLISDQWWDEQTEARVDGYSYLFAFSSLQKLHQWFRGEIHILISHGYSIVEYEEDEYQDWPVFRGGRQVIFAVPNLGPYAATAGHHGAPSETDWPQLVAAFGPDEWNPDEMPYD